MRSRKRLREFGAWYARMVAERWGATSLQVTGYLDLVMVSCPLCHCAPRKRLCLELKHAVHGTLATVRACQCGWHWGCYPAEPGHELCRIAGRCEVHAARWLRGYYHQNLLLESLREPAWEVKDAD